MNEQNPYAPPKAPVSDLDNSAKPPVPRHVETACQLMWIGLGFEAFDAVVKMISNPTMTVILGMTIGALISFGIGYLFVRWFTRELRAGKNWMRWLLTILNALSWMTVPVFWDFYVKYLTPVLSNPISAVSLLAQSTISVTAIVLLHTPSSREWFSGADAG